MDVRPFHRCKFVTTVTARNTANDVAGDACKIVPNNKNRFRYRNRYARVEK